MSKAQFAYRRTILPSKCPGWDSNPHLARRKQEALPIELRGHKRCRCEKFADPSHRHYIIKSFGRTMAKPETEKKAPKEFEDHEPGPIRDEVMAALVKAAKPVKKPVQ